MRLNQKQIKVISSDLEQADIYYSHLSDDLLDHICCDIENAMQKGDDFVEAYKRVKQKIGIRGLERIQEDTLLLTDKLYNIMKTVSKISGVTSAVILSVASLLKINHVEGAGILIFLGFISTIIFFLPSVLIALYKETNNSRLLIQFMAAFFSGLGILGGFLFKIMHWPGGSLLLLGGFVFIVLFFCPAVFWNKLKENPGKKWIYLTGFIITVLYLTGICFKFFHWPGAHLLLMGSSLLFAFIFFPLYAKATFFNSDKFIGKFLFLTIVLMWAFLTSMLIRIKLSETHLRPFIEANAKLNKQIHLIENSNAALMSAFNDKEKFTKLFAQKKELIGMLHKIERDIQSMCYENGIKVDENERLVFLSNTEFPTVKMVGSNKKEGQGEKLYNELLSYEELLKSEYKFEYKILEKFNYNNEVLNANTWIEGNFKHVSIAYFQNTLKLLETYILLAENKVLNQK